MRKLPFYAAALLAMNAQALTIPETLCGPEPTCKVGDITIIASPPSPALTVISDGLTYTGVVSYAPSNSVLIYHPYGVLTATDENGAMYSLSVSLTLQNKRVSGSGRNHPVTNRWYVSGTVEQP